MAGGSFYKLKQIVIGSFALNETAPNGALC